MQGIHDVIQGVFREKDDKLHRKRCILDCSTRVESMLKDISHGLDDDVLRTFCSEETRESRK